MFDPANAIVPFFLKANQHNAEAEYRLCVFINPKLDLNDQIDYNESKDIYIQVGNVLEVIDRIVFSSEDGLIMEEIRDQFHKVLCDKGNFGELNFNWEVLSANAIELTICSKQPEESGLNIHHDISESGHRFKCCRPIESNGLSLFSSKYDSMKQRFILMNGNR